MRREPTCAPTREPTCEPASEPTGEPTGEPTREPTPRRPPRPLSRGADTAGSSRAPRQFPEGETQMTTRSRLRRRAATPGGPR
ncbi:PT domain-containing protein [Streptomyces sp. KL118A]|uniref:PT domain-containing protein n=1 Tax=Streptomyces sp. KL118A TaxID=3045153 RepID=UPI0035318256